MFNDVTGCLKYFVIVGLTVDRFVSLVFANASTNETKRTESL